jgi:hypothetical protein
MADGPRCDNGLGLDDDDDDDGSRYINGSGALDIDGPGCGLVAAIAGGRGSVTSIGDGLGCGLATAIDDGPATTTDDTRCSLSVGGGGGGGVGAH